MFSSFSFDESRFSTEKSDAIRREKIKPVVALVVYPLALATRNKDLLRVMIFHHGMIGKNEIFIVANFLKILSLSDLLDVDENSSFFF